VDDELIIASMVVHAINSLPDPSPDSSPCCTHDCAPCEALAVLHSTGRLSDAVRPYVVSSSSDPADPGWDWWRGNVEKGGVVWAWLAARLCDPQTCESASGDR